MNRPLTVLLTVAIIGGCAGWYMLNLYPLQRYNARSRQIAQKIEALRGQRPSDVDEKVWDETVNWAGIAFGNICFSEGHVPYTEMCAFERDFDAKLVEGPVDLEFFEWHWARLAQTGPHGKDYVCRMQRLWHDVLEWMPADAAR